MLPRKYPSILPAATPRHEGPSPSTDALQEDTNKRKRIGTQVACNSCRVKKTRCDGVRPNCGPCRKRAVDCTYATRRGAGEEAQELLSLLKTLPEQRAFFVLHLLRATNGDCAAALTLLKAGEADAPTPPERSTGRDDAPLRKSALDMELSARHPVAYPVQPPVAAAVWQNSNLLRPATSAQPPSPSSSSSAQPHLSLGPAGRPADPTLAGSSSLTMGGVQPSTPDDPTRAGSGSLAMDGIQSAAPQSPAYPHVSLQAPYIDADSAVNSYRSRDSATSSQTPPIQYCDQRLEALRISYWTSVPVGDSFAARVISLYLVTDHPLVGTFDPDLFVADLVDQRQAFCSPVLVNALLYWGCQIYSAIDRSADHYTERFCAEAERLWTSAKDSDSLLNMASAQILSIAYLGHGKDRKYLEYISVAVNMGVRLQVFGVDAATMKTRYRDLPLDMQRATSFTAWGVFNWAILTALFYRQPGIVFPESPPQLPVPGQIPGESGDSEGVEPTDEYSATPVARHLPSYMGRTLPALCHFWRILHDVAGLYSCKGTAANELPSIQTAEFKFREVLAFIENLPPELARAPDNAHHVVVFHIWLHAAVLDIFRPFVKRSLSGELKLRTFAAPGSSPADAFNASVEQLKHLIIHYRSHFESSAYTILWQPALTYVANAVLASKDANWRLYFLLCIYGYESLRRPFRVAEAIGTSLLSMTLRDDADILADEARRLLLALKARGLRSVSGEVRATFMADLELAMSDPEAARVENLASDFEDMALFREFVNNNAPNEVGMSG